MLAKASGEYNHSKYIIPLIPASYKSFAQKKGYNLFKATLIYFFPKILTYPKSCIIIIIYEIILKETAFYRHNS